MARTRSIGAPKGDKLGTRERAMHALIEKNREKIAALCRRYGVRRLDAFGSVVRADFDPARSDVDVLVDFGNNSALSPLAQYFDFKESLEALFGRPVDIISSGNIRNPYVRRAVERDKIPVYGA